jgi:hypothetical protein
VHPPAARALEFLARRAAAVVDAVAVQAREGGLRRGPGNGGGGAGGGLLRQLPVFALLGGRVRGGVGRVAGVAGVRAVGVV